MPVGQTNVAQLFDSYLTNRRTKDADWYQATPDTWKYGEYVITRVNKGGRTFLYELKIPNQYMPKPFSLLEDAKAYVITHTQDAQVHAPAGGVSVKGKEFKGGEFIPTEGGYAEAYKKQVEEEGTKSGNESAPSKESKKETVQIPIGHSSKAKQDIPRYMYHDIPHVSLEQSEGLKAYDLRKGDRPAVDVFNNVSPDDKFIWLRPEKKYDSSVKVDMSKLTPEDMRMAGGEAESVLHHGSIPESAIVREKKSESEGGVKAVDPQSVESKGIISRQVPAEEESKETNNIDTLKSYGEKFNTDKKNNMKVAMDAWIKMGIHSRILDNKIPQFIRDGIKKKGSAFHWQNPDTGVDEIIINPYSKNWDDPKWYAIHNGSDGNKFYSSSDPARMLLHEYAHYLYGDSPSAEHNFINDHHFKSVVKEQVGAYAASNVKEFIAEVYVGLQTGKKYSDQIMDHYNSYKQDNFHYSEKTKDHKATFDNYLAWRKTKTKDKFTYKSTNRPIWMGFGSVIKQDYTKIDDRTFTTEKEIPEELCVTLELEKVSTKDADFKEEEHPRAKEGEHGGEFVAKGAGGGGASSKSEASHESKKTEKIQKTPKSKYLYHVTFTKNVSKIKEKGLLPFQTTNWKTGEGKRYGAGEVYAFENAHDAVHWAAKMDWDFRKEIGGESKGGISIVKIKNNGDWKEDTNDPLAHVGGKGKWFKSESRVTPEDVVEHLPVKQDLIKRYIAEEDLSDVFEKESNGSGSSSELHEEIEPPSKNVIHPDTVAKLEAGKKLKMYRAMQLIDGKLYPPMSAMIGNKLRPPIEIGKWEQSVEAPELADKEGKFKLEKGNKKTVPARYNPYFHTSTSPLNDQFSEAYNRPNLVVVEVEIPESELTSGYKAENAKDVVGEVNWHSGVVNTKLPKESQRKIILSRYSKAIRVVPDDEVAKIIAPAIKKNNVPVPENTITPSLKKELIKRGVNVVPAQKIDRTKKVTDYQSFFDSFLQNRKTIDGKSEIAKASYVESTKERQDVAEAVEDEVAGSIVNAERTAGNSPFDIIVGNIALEIKSLIETDVERVQMRKDSRENKEVFLKDNPDLIGMTILVDRRNPEPVTIYFKEGVGAFRVGSMEKIEAPSLKEALLKIPLIGSHVKEVENQILFDSFLQNRKTKDKLSTMKFQGLDITIENEVGSQRHWKSATEEGVITMKVPYGYINGTVGADGDELDCFVGKSQYAPSAFIVRQMNEQGYDEEKVFLGFDTIEEAKEAYLQHVNKEAIMGDITEMAMHLFKATLYN